MSSVGEGNITWKKKKNFFLYKSYTAEQMKIKLWKSKGEENKYSDTQNKTNGSLKHFWVHNIRTLHTGWKYTKIVWEANARTTN